MMKSSIVAGAVFLLAVSGTAANQDKPQIVKRPPPQIDASDAKGMFKSYCGPCHGESGKGDGPAAAALKTVPADLTRISQRNGGTFPTSRVRRFIEGADEITAHGSRDMPVWGDVLRSVGDKPEVTLRIENLTKYVASIQQK